MTYITSIYLCVLQTAILCESLWGLIEPNECQWWRQGAVWVYDASCHSVDTPYPGGEWWCCVLLMSRLYVCCWFHACWCHICMCGVDVTSVCVLMSSLYVCCCHVCMCVDVTSVCVLMSSLYVWCWCHACMCGVDVTSVCVVLMSRLLMSRLLMSRS